jgi:hypothetical protein
MNRDEQMARDLGCFFVVSSVVIFTVGLVVGAALVVIFR